MKKQSFWYIVLLIVAAGVAIAYGTRFNTTIPLYEISFFLGFTLIYLFLPLIRRTVPAKALKLITMVYALLFGFISELGFLFYCDLRNEYLGMLENFLVVFLVTIGGWVVVLFIEPKEKEYFEYSDEEFYKLRQRQREIIESKERRKQEEAARACFKANSKVVTLVISSNEGKIYHQWEFISPDQETIRKLEKAKKHPLLRYDRDQVVMK